MTQAQLIAKSLKLMMGTFPPNFKMSVPTILMGLAFKDFKQVSFLNWKTDGEMIAFALDQKHIGSGEFKVKLTVYFRNHRLEIVPGEEMQLAERLIELKNQTVENITD